MKIHYIIFGAEKNFKNTKMKTVKESGKPKKVSSKKETLQSMNVDILKPAPSEEDIRQKAAEIYYHRLVRGENGSATEDWFKAESFFYGVDEL